MSLVAAAEPARTIKGRDCSGLGKLRQDRLLAGFLAQKVPKMTDSFPGLSAKAARPSVGRERNELTGTWKLVLAQRLISGRI